MKFIKALLIIQLILIVFLCAIIVGYKFIYEPNYQAKTDSANYTNIKNEPRIVASTPIPTTTPIDNSIKKTVLPETNNFKWEVLDNNDILTNYNREKPVIFGSPDKYSSIEGITTFRGNNYRDSAAFGFADISEEKLEKVWFCKTGYIDSWTGIGWNGQPAIVKWDDETKNIMNISQKKKEKSDLKEIIYAALDGKIYFIDLEDGLPTRDPIDIGYPIKGSVTVDPRGYPILYSGQGINEKTIEVVEKNEPAVDSSIESDNEKNVDNTTQKTIKKKILGPFGYRIFNLINQKELLFINGYDKMTLRKWGAFDSVALVNKETDTLIECGENGILYTINLNTKYDPSKSSISIQPEFKNYRYYPTFRDKIGMENSPAIYKNLIYFTDNGGLLQCVDLNTLSPIWIQDVTDDSDSTIALEEKSEDEVFLYTANEVDLQCADLWKKQQEEYQKKYKQDINTPKPKTLFGKSYVRKFNALNGDLLWEKSYDCIFDNATNGGAIASPVVGKNDISNLVIYNIAKTENNIKGKLVALDKETGKEVWVDNLNYYCWSSPVDVYTNEGKSYLIVCDSGGYMNLIEGTSGKILDKIPLEANIEGSPAIYENMVIVGTRGQKIWGVKIK